MGLRLKEAHRLGFKRAVVPAAELKDKSLSMMIEPVAHINELAP
jgi:predicted ATP-dependent serine protease